MRWRRATGYDAARLVHGEAVAIGMALAHRFSARLNLAPRQDAARVEAHLKTSACRRRLQRHARRPAGSAERLLDAIAQDKKVKRGALTFILRAASAELRRPGVPARTVRKFLDREFYAPK